MMDTASCKMVVSFAISVLDIVAERIRDAME